MLILFCFHLFQNVIVGGGGFSVHYPRPSYQDQAVSTYLSSAQGKAAVSGYNPGGRGFPDLSFVGVQYSAIVGQSWTIFYGTSASAPVAAGLSELYCIHIPWYCLNICFNVPFLFNHISLHSHNDQYSASGGGSRYSRLHQPHSVPTGQRSQVQRRHLGQQQPVQCALRLHRLSERLQLSGRMGPRHRPRQRQLRQAIHDVRRYPWHQLCSVCEPSLVSITKCISILYQSHCRT